MATRIVLVMVGLLLAGQMSGCAHYPVNQRSDTYVRDGGYRFENLTAGPNNTDDLFICLAFSGGGTRAAALAFGVMEELRRTKFKGREKTLLDEVDVISSVSGGSFTAAYYGLFRKRLFDDFRPKFLERNIQGALVARLVNPVNLVRVASPWFGRIDLAAELYDRDLFQGATFAQLEQQGRPFIILNATNLGPGRRFDFTQDYFDAIGSRLDRYPVARAVAASSAFPFLLSAISLEKYPPAEGYEPPWWYEGALKPTDWTTRRYQAAKNLDRYRDRPSEYVHLMDGGLADNIGVRAILDAYDHGFLQQKLSLGEITHLVMIIVNARTEDEDRLSRRESPPGLLTVAAKTATIAMDNYSFESIDRLRATLRERIKAQNNIKDCQQLLDTHATRKYTIPRFKKDVDIFVVEINFEAAGLVGEDPRYYLDLPTSFKLTPEQLQKLIDIGPRLLKASPQYQRLLRVLGAEPQEPPRPPESQPGAGMAGE